MFTPLTPAWKVWLCAVLCTIACAVYALPIDTRIPPRNISHLPPLQVGDWVFRMGTTADSRIIRHVGKGRFSHIGVLVQTTPKPMVIHATTDDGYAQKNQVLLTPLNEFLSPKLAHYYAITRPNFINTAIKKQVSQALYKKLGKAFILTAKGEPNLYCTTLIEQAIIKYEPTFKPRWKQVDVALFEGEYLFPDALYHYPNTSVVYSSLAYQN